MKKLYKAKDDRFDSKFEEDFEKIWIAHSRYPIVHHHKVKSERHWEIDFAFPDLRIAIELQGHGTGHLSYAAQLRDIEKHNDLLLLGWTVVYFMTTHITTPRYITGTLDTLMERKHGQRIREYRNQTSTTQLKPTNLLDARRRLSNQRPPYPKG